MLHVARLKDGLSTTHPLRGDELRAIAAWMNDRARMKPPGSTVFVSEQRRPLHRSTVNLALRKYSAAAEYIRLVHLVEMATRRQMKNFSQTVCKVYP